MTYRRRLAAERVCAFVSVNRELSASSVIYGKVLSATHNHAAAAQKQQQQHQKRTSTVRLLVTSAGATTTEPDKQI